MEFPVGTHTRNWQASSGMAFGSFFLVWTGAFAIIHAMIVVMK